MLKAVLLDLDDTVFDHRHSRRCGLRALRSRFKELRPVPIGELEKEHERLLQSNYSKVLDGTITGEDTMMERVRALLAMHGVSPATDEVKRTTALYREAYDRGRRPVPGVKELVRKLKNRRMTLGIVTNGLPEAQKEKLRICGMIGAFDHVMISEEVGARKPDERIFRESLRRTGALPGEAVYIGDSWDTDIVGAHGCGIRAIWLNRYGLACPDEGMAREIGSFKPVESVARLIFDPASP